MLEIEFEEPSTFTCECCQGTTTRLTRFVYQDEDAFGVYYAVFSDKHRHDGVVGIVSLGEWGEDEIPASRVAFSFRLWEGEDNYNVMISDANESEWSDVEILGRKLTREEALDHPWIEDVYLITDHMCDKDAEIREFFSPETIYLRK